MIEVPCTLRCDGCGETKPIVAEAKPAPDGNRVLMFAITGSVLSAGWRVVLDELRCPRCNGVK